MMKKNIWKEYINHYKGVKYLKLNYLITNKMAFKKSIANTWKKTKKTWNIGVAETKKALPGIKKTFKAGADAAVSLGQGLSKTGESIHKQFEPRTGQYPKSTIANPYLQQPRRNVIYQRPMRQESSFNVITNSARPRDDYVQLPLKPKKGKVTAKRTMKVKKGKVVRKIKYYQEPDRLGFGFGGF